MKLRLMAIGLILVGVGAIALAVVQPTFGGSSGSKYITSTVTTGTVSAQSVANGTIAASTVYGLKFGSMPDIVSSASTTSGSGGTTSSNSNSSSSSAVIWPVQTVSASVGQRVTKGTTLATADATAAQLQLASAQATLASAQSKLATDQGGPDSVTLAQAKNSLSQSWNSYSQARASLSNTNAQNALTLGQAQAAVTAAQNQLATDQAASPPVSVSQIDKDNAAITQAQQSLATTQLKVDQSNQQASQQVTSASLSYQAAQLQYQSKTSPAASSTILADQATVASAQTTVNAYQAAVTGATLVAPADGLIIAVNILPGVNAPSSYAIQISVGPMVATSSFAESDITNLKIGQTATVSVTGAKVSVPGTLTQIVPVASSVSGSSSVATYSVTVTLTSPPLTVLAGMSATVTVTTASVDNALRVPATALQGSATAGYTVLLLNSGSDPTTVDVKVGLVTTSMAQITSGLQSGDTVVTGSTASRTGTTTTGANSGINIQSLTGGGAGPAGFGR